MFSFSLLDDLHLLKRTKTIGEMQEDNSGNEGGQGQRRWLRLLTANQTEIEIHLIHCALDVAKSERGMGKGLNAAPLTAFGPWHNQQQQQWERERDRERERECQQHLNDCGSVNGNALLIFMLQAL
ncbi:hypothetical protein ACLKA6_009153 [Drosophila palustris]